MSIFPVDNPGEELGSSPPHTAGDLGTTWGGNDNFSPEPCPPLTMWIFPLWTRNTFGAQYGAQVSHPEIFRITTICLGNICRSPMAEVVLRDRIQRAGLADAVVVDSAGTGDWHIGYPADPRASATLDASQYERTEHRARQINEQWIADIDLALVMDSANFLDVTSIVNRSGAVTDLRMFRSFDPMLAHFVPPNPDLDVPDPYYGGDDGFVEVLQMIERASDGLVADLQLRLS